MTAPSDLYEAALAAQTNAYSPYSKYRVGAAIRLASGEIYSGCNVENASYGATICAERGAIMSAVAKEGAIQVVEILVITDSTPPWPPCGMCRQVLAEFVSPDCVLWCCNNSGDAIAQPFTAIFPQSFDASHLA